MAGAPASTKAAQKDLGRRVAELRRDRGHTQETIAEALGMLTPNYARIEQGRQNVTMDTLVRIARVLDVGLVELFRVPRARSTRASKKPARPRT
jgi:transcriptional regulator with XRE-family HTH domain